MFLFWNFQKHYKFLETVSEATFFVRQNVTYHEDAIFKTIHLSSVESAVCSEQKE